MGLRNDYIINIDGYLALIRIYHNCYINIPKITILIHIVN